jgi:Tfp pilus assembly protein PilO
MNHDPGYKWIVPIAGLVLAVIAAVGGYLHHRAVETRRTEVRQIEDQVVHLEALHAVRDQTARRIERMQQRLDRLQAGVPDQGHMGQLLEQLGVQLDAVGAGRRQSQTDEARPAGPFERTPLAIQFNGSFAGLCRVLDAAESFERLVHVDQLTITREKIHGTNPLQVVMELSVFTASAEVAQP